MKYIRITSIYFTMLCLFISSCLVYMVNDSFRRELKSLFTKTGRSKRIATYVILRKSSQEMMYFYPLSFISGCFFGVLCDMVSFYIVGLLGNEAASLTFQSSTILGAGLFVLMGAILLPVIFPMPSTLAGDMFIKEGN